MQRSHLASLITTIVAATVIALGGGCGGGGGGGTTSTSASSGGTGTPTVLALVATSGLSTTSRDLANTVEGETLTVQALSVDRNGVGTLLPVTSLRVNAPSSVATSDETTSQIVAINASNTGYAVSARVSGKTLTTTLRVSAASERTPVNGVVRTLSASSVAGATINFYGPSSSTVLTSVLVGADGTYQANVPDTATRFSIDISDLKGADGDTLYYATYGVGDLYYDNGLSCYPPLSLITSSGTPADSIFNSKIGGSVPPPPTGCLG